MTSADFTINGRFLTQRVTGVQRYARNVVTAMNAALLANGRQAAILAPGDAADLALPRLPLTVLPTLRGHAWEQLTLPQHAGGCLLSLCNTGPIAKTDQVICLHDASVYDAPESYSAAFRTLYRAIQPQLARRAARIASVSKHSAERIGRHLPIKSADIVVLPNGHEHALRWEPARAERAPTLVSPDSRPFILAIGSRARHKNLDLLIDISPALDALGLDVVIAGGGDGIFAPAKLQSAPNVKQLQDVTDDDLAYLMQHALCLAFPSWTEGFGLPIVEAMARGCPVVSSDRASMPEVCGDAALMAAPDAPAAWIEHFTALKRSEQLRLELSQRAKQHVKQFSWDRTAEGYIQLMRDPTRRTHMNARVSDPNIAVVFATLGRPEVVAANVRRLLQTQTLKPRSLIISCASAEDAGDAVSHAGVQLLLGPKGLPAQRNTALKALPADTDIVVFFDDDFVADPNWLAAAARAFAEESDLVGFTGHVLVDDIKGPGLSFEDAARIVDDNHAAPSWTRIEPYSPYGCNMAFRHSAIGDLCFDERLVLYGWLEDRDFAASLARNGGRFVKCASARGVHMGTKRGRVAGDRLGYSQIVNPLYMLRKGTMTPVQVADHIFRNVASNLARAPVPEPFVDRRGRLRGNLLGAADVLRGRLRPERAAAIEIAKSQQR